jgi:hypothetical protein
VPEVSQFREEQINYVRLIAVMKRTSIAESVARSD